MIVAILSRSAECLDPDEVRKYAELKNEFEAGVTDRKGWSERFSNYYQVNRWTTTNWKNAFFEIMHGKRITGTRDEYQRILLALYKFPRKTSKGMRKTLEFSFVSKLVALHDESCPIYDANVGVFFGIVPPSFGDEEFRIEGFIENLETIKERYEKWVADPEFKSILGRARERIKQLQTCSDIRVLDFLVWATGTKEFNSK